MYSEWITSWLIMLIRIGSPVGTCRSLISACPPGCWNFHIHCRPIASIWVALAGGVLWPTNMLAPQAKKISVRVNGMNIQLSSSIRSRVSV